MPDPTDPPKKLTSALAVIAESAISERLIGVEHGIPIQETVVEDPMEQRMHDLKVAYEEAALKMREEAPNARQKIDSLLNAETHAPPDFLQRRQLTHKYAHPTKSGPGRSTRKRRKNKRRN